MSSCDLTISIVSYNTKSLVEECIHSIIAKTHDISYEIILVDNMSKDGTPEMVEADFPGVKVIRSGKNMGFSSANNIAMKHARGRYFVLLNSDASLINDALSEMVHFMDKHPDAGIACPQLYYPDGRLQVSHYPFRSPKGRALREVRPRVQELKRIITRQKFVKPEKTKRKSLDAPKQVARPRGVCFLIRNECIREIGLMDGNLFIFAEDVDWAWRAKKAGWKRYIVPQAKVCHQDHASVSQKATMMQQIQMQSVYYFFYRHFGFKAWLGIRLGNLAGAVLAFFLGTATSILGSRGSSAKPEDHFQESMALFKLATLTKRVVPPDAK